MNKTVHHHHSNACLTRMLLAAMLCMAASSVRAQDYSSFFSGNGSFELGSSPPPLSFPSSHSTVTTITGLWLTASGQYPQWLEDSNAQDGNHYIRLRSTGGAGAGFSGALIEGGLISHTPFTVGELYELSFWAAGGPAADNLVRVSLAGPSVIDFNLPIYTQAEFDALAGLEWSEYVVPFVATHTTMVLSLISPQSTQGGYQSIVYLDNFSLAQVPEPGTAVLAAAGGLVLLVGRRRRDER